MTRDDAPGGPAPEGWPDTPVPNTPGPAGYLVAWAVSVAVFTTLWVLTPLPGEGLYFSDPEEFVGIWSAVAFYAAVVSMVVAPPGLAFVHLACRTTEEQSVHVVDAGIVGLLVGLVPAALGLGLLVPLQLAVATAIARACVIPLVPGQDDDSVAPSRRC